MESDQVYLGPAAAGTVWVLSHTEPMRGWPARHTFLEAYRDPYAALVELATRIRPRWADQRARMLIANDAEAALVPVDPPADDHEAVAVYFRPNGRYRDGETFELVRLAIEDACPPDRPDSPEHVLVLPYGEWVCTCGNMSHTTGFEFCDAAGNVTDDAGDDWPGLYLCPDCGRIIDGSIGRVEKRLTRCRHCGEPVTHAPDPISQGTDVWQHVSGGHGHIACAGGATVAAPAEH